MYIIIFFSVSWHTVIPSLIFCSFFLFPPKHFWAHLFFRFLDLFLFYVYEYFPACVYRHHVSVHEGEGRVVKSGIIDGYELPCGYQEPKLGSLQQQQVLFFFFIWNEMWTFIGMLRNEQHYHSPHVIENTFDPCCGRKRIRALKWVSNSSRGNPIQPRAGCSWQHCLCSKFQPGNPLPQHELTILSCHSSGPFTEGPPLKLRISPLCCGPV